MSHSLGELKLAAHHMTTTLLRSVLASGTQALPAEQPTPRGWLFRGRARVP